MCVQWIAAVLGRQGIGNTLGRAQNESITRPGIQAAEIEEMEATRK